MAELPDRDIGELALKTRCIMFIADFECYRSTGKPLLPKGFHWIKALDGPELVWRPKGDHRWTDLS